MQLNVGLLGGGSWGTTVASLVARNTPTLLWARDGETVAEINEQHTNTRYLPDAKLSAKLLATADLEEAVRSADVLVMGIPSQSFRTVLQEVAHYIRPWVPVISLSKGLEQGSRERMVCRRQRHRHGRRGHREGPAAGVSLRSVPGLHEHRRHRL
jgi:glycerol-3-phosphate dehydrogenase (NAD(P)+)